MALRGHPSLGSVISKTLGQYRPRETIDEKMTVRNDLDQPRAHDNTERGQVFYFEYAVTKAKLAHFSTFSNRLFKPLRHAIFR
jgi:hypothetical protein